MLRGLPKGPELASKLLRDGLVRLDDDFAALYARALGASEAEAATLGKQLMAGRQGMERAAEIVDTFAPGDPTQIVKIGREPQLTRSQIVETATEHVGTLRPRGDPNRLIPALVRLILRLGGRVPPS